MNQLLTRVTAALALGPWLTGCAFYGTLLGYPSAPEPREFRYYDSNFSLANRAVLQTSCLRFEGYYCNRDAEMTTYNHYIQGEPIPRQAYRYRYLKFFADGRVVRMNTFNPPDSAIHRALRRAPWFTTGYFKPDGDTVRLEFKDELEGNKSYFWKAVATENGVRELPGLPRKLLLFHDYQYLPD